MELTRAAPPLSRQLAGLIGWVLLVVFAGAIGAVGSANAPAFYAALSKPAWAPPASWFGPVWTALYLMMGVAAWRVWRRDGFDGARTALGLFLAQLALNVLWSWLFFAWESGGLAFACIVVLWCLIVATLVAFWRHDRVAGLLLVPYLAWVSFATALSFTVWQMNPQML